MNRMKLGAAKREYDRKTIEVIRSGIDDFLSSIYKGSALQVEECRYGQKCMPTGQLLGVIGFAGDGVKGTLAVKADQQFLLGTDPLGRSSIDLNEQVDWLQEITNRLMGQIKGRFVMHHVGIDMGVPAVASGEEVMITNSEIAPTVTFNVRLGDARCQIFFCAIIEDDVSFDSEPDEELLFGAAGNAVIF